jgi:hypothetical protein
MRQARDPSRRRRWPVNRGEWWVNLESVRLIVLLAAASLAACKSPVPPRETVKIDPTQEAWYRETVHKLVEMNRQAQRLFQEGKTDDAAAMITAAEPWEKRVVSVPRPTFPALEAASDRDDLYGRMLLANRNYGWARILFQTNLARWRSWRPQTPETARRLKLTEAAIAECDRRLAE